MQLPCSFPTHAAPLRPEDRLWKCAFQSVNTWLSVHSGDWELAPGRLRGIRGLGRSPWSQVTRLEASPRGGAGKPTHGTDPPALARRPLPPVCNGEHDTNPLIVKLQTRKGETLRWEELLAGRRHRCTRFCSARRRPEEARAQQRASARGPRGAPSKGRLRSIRWHSERALNPHSCAVSHKPLSTRGHIVPETQLAQGEMRSTRTAHSSFQDSGPMKLLVPTTR